MTSLFISYSRKDTDCARRLTEAFKAQEFDFWIDWESIPLSVDWWNEVKKGIEQAGVFLFLVSPDSIRSRVCRQEIDHALKNGKRLIPIVVRDVKVEDTPTVLSHLNWIFIRENDDFDAAFSKLVTAIKTDYEWVRAHRGLQVKALEWDRSKRDKSFLLRGTELQLAEFQLATNTSKEPHPTDLQKEYIAQSRRSADKQRNTTIGIGVAVGIALTALAIFGWIQAVSATTSRRTAEAASTNAIAQQNIAQTKAQEADQQAAAAKTAQANAVSSEKTAMANQNKALTQEAHANAERIRADNSATKATANEQEAKRQAKIAFSRQLAAEALVLKTEKFDLALLLAIEASQGSIDGQLSLSNLLLAEPHLKRIVSSPKGYIWEGNDMGFIDSLVLSPDGNQLVAKSYAGSMFWDLNTYQNLELDTERFQQDINAWSPYQRNPSDSSELENLFQTVDFYTLSGTPSVVSNRWAVPACRTRPSAGGAPGCASLIYIIEKDFERLVSPITNCSVGNGTSDLKIDLKGGSFTITGLHGKADQPANFELYSVTLENLASNNGSQLVGALYDLQTNRLATAAAYGRFFSKMALIVWDLNDKKPVMEYFRDQWDAQNAKIDFSSSGTALDVCIGGSGIRIDVNQQSWQTQACEIAGRNFTITEWKQYFPDEEYRKTCDQWPLEQTDAGTQIPAP